MIEPPPTVHVSAEQADRLARLEPLLPRFRERRRMYDDAAEFPAANFADLRAVGLLVPGVPKSFGGHGFWWDSFVEYYQMYEAIAAACSSTGQLYQIATHGAGLLAWNATPEQRAKYLPDVVEKGLLIASVGSEADPRATTADIYKAELQETGNGWRLSCHKHFASLGPGADYLLIWTSLPGTGTYMERQVFVLVPRDAPEVELINEWDTSGMRATASWGIKITDYPVPQDAIIGEPGAWARDPRTFTLAYVTNHMGTAQGAFDLACQFVRERPYLADNQVIQVALGEMASQLAVTRSSLYTAARLWEEAAAEGFERSIVDRAELLGLQALHVSKQVALDVTRRVFDVCGARAAFRSMPFEAMFRDVRTFTLHHRDYDYMSRVGRAAFDGPHVARLGTYIMDSQPAAPKGDDRRRQ
jgi:alkylation response protein AidB-like acyl-CoA dehydrogenase